MERFQRVFTQASLKDCTCGRQSVERVSFLPRDWSHGQEEHWTLDFWTEREGERKREANPHHSPGERKKRERERC